MSIVEFLLARVAEDEAAARAADPGPWLVVGERDHCDDTWFVSSSEHGILWETEGSMFMGGRRDTMRHIAAWDPTRVLADCEAKRLIIRLVGSPDPHTVEETTDGECNECAVLYAMARVYVDHEDYRDEWRL